MNLAEKPETSRKIEECYGVKCLNCTEPCPLQSCGISVIREKQAELARINGRGNILYLDGIGSGLDGGDSLEESFPEEIRRAITASPDEAGPEKRELFNAVNRLAFLYLEQPRVFDALIRAIYLGQKQADIARDRGVTRSAISKELREGIANLMTRELGMRTPVAGTRQLLDLTPKEFAVYKLLFCDGCSERSVAAQLGISKSTVHRMGQHLRRKLGKNGAKNRKAGKRC